MFDIRTRSRKRVIEAEGGGETALSVILPSDGEVEFQTTTATPEWNITAMQAPFAKPHEHGNDLTPVPQSDEEAMTVIV